MLRLNTIGKKISAGYVVLALMMLAAVGMTVWQVQQHAKISDRLREVSAPTSHVSMQMLNGVNQSLAALRGWIILGEKGYLNQMRLAWSEQIEPALKKMEQLEAYWVHQEDRDRFVVLKSRLKRFEQFQRQISEVAQTESNVPMLRVFSEEVEPLLEEVIDRVASLAAANRKRLIGLRIETDLVAEQLQTFETLDAYHTASEALRAEIISYLLSGKEYERKNYIKAQEKEVLLFESMVELVGVLEEKEQNSFREIQQIREGFIFQVQSILKSRGSPDWNLATYWLGSRASPAADEIVKLLRALSSNAQAQMLDDFARSKEQNQMLISIEWLLLFMGISMSVFLGVVITRSVTKPIDEALHVANDVSRGDYSRDVNISGSKEIVELGDAFKRMVRSLKETAKTAKFVADGDLNVEVAVRGEKDSLGISLNAMIQSLRQSSHESELRLAQIKNSEARANSIIQTMNDGLVNFNNDGIITLFNPAAENMFFYSAEEIVGCGDEPRSLCTG